MFRLFNIWCDPKFDNIMFWKELIRDQGSFYLPYWGWYLDYPSNCTLVSKRSEQEKFDVGYLEKFASSQGNKKEDIDKRRKKKKDVQVSNTLKAVQTPMTLRTLNMCEATFVPLLPVLQGNYAWKHKCYRWKTNVSVFLDVRLRS